MPDIDNDDIDNLFRQAAEGYPLRTNSSDWDKVARKLDGDKNEETFIMPPVYTGKEKNKRRRILLLLLLLPLLGIGYYLYNDHSSTSIKNTKGGQAQTGKKTLAQKTGTTNETIIDKETNNTDREKDVINKSAGVNNSVHKKEQGSVAKKIKNKEKITAADSGVGIKNTNKIFSPVHKNYTNHSGNEIKNSNHKNIVSKKLVNQRNKSKAVFEKIFEEKYTGTIESKNLLNTVINNEEASNAELHSISGFSIISLACNNISSPDVINKNLNSSVIPFFKTDSNSVNDKKKKTANKKQPSFYAGVIVAPDLSTIKFQSIKGTGYSAGILLGYAISNKISLESGVYYDYKKYYTRGEYYHGKQSFLSYVDLVNVNGGCRMIEVPVNLKYNFITNDKTNWFATTGLSSYFMFKEGYTYNYLYNGMTGQKYYTYNSGSQNWFSVLNISAGYEHKIGNVANLRLEPYLRIPLSGMGTGSLPIMSVGLNVGVTHSFK